jgi:hypothetical protein
VLNETCIDLFKSEGGVAQCAEEMFVRSRARHASVVLISASAQSNVNTNPRSVSVRTGLMSPDAGASR